MHIEQETLNGLKSLSKELFGSPNRYQKLLERGVSELVTKKVTETVPNEDGTETTREVNQPVLLNGAKQFKQVYFTPETLLEKLKLVKVQRDEFMAEMKKQQEAAAAAKKQQEAIQEAAGSAL